MNTIKKYENFNNFYKEKYKDRKFIIIIHSLSNLFN